MSEELKPCQVIPCRGKLHKVAPLLWRCDGEQQHLWIGNPDVRLAPVIHESEQALASELEIAGRSLAEAEARAERAERERDALIRWAAWPENSGECWWVRPALPAQVRYASEAEAVAAVRAAAGLDAGREDSHADD